MAGSLFNDYKWSLCANLIFKHVNMSVCLTLGTEHSFILFLTTSLPEIFHFFQRRNYSISACERRLKPCYFPQNLMLFQIIDKSS